MTARLGLLAVLLGLGCATAAPEDSVARGGTLYRSTALSPSTVNTFTCATCHAASPGDAGGRLLTGAPLAGAPFRSSFWGGQENDLLQSINACRADFMLASTPLSTRDADAVALYDFLVNLGTDGAAPVAFTVVATVADVPRGDVGRGATLFTNACGACHGAAHTGAGRNSPRIPVLPEDTLAEHSDYSPQAQRLVFVEKIRHGGFFGYGGEMPPFSAEVLGDGDVGDILEYLGTLGGGS